MIEFSSFSGQLTDVEVWDYPIRYKDVVSYMYRGYYRYVYLPSNFDHVTPISVISELNGINNEFVQYTFTCIGQ